MKTQEAVSRFLTSCQERGLSSESIRKYRGYLGRFVDYAQELPTELTPVENYLKRNKETPAHRGVNYKVLQAFYSYLEEFENITSPVPGKGRVGRPAKYQPIVPGSQVTQQTLTLQEPSKTGSQPGQEETGTKILTAGAVDQFVRSRINQGVSPRTLECYRFVFKPFVRKYMTLPLTTEEIEEFLGSLQVAPMSKWTYCRTLKAFYRWLESRKMIPKELIVFPKIKIPRKVRRVLDEEQLRKLFNFTKTYQELAILKLLVDSKIRASELITLTREQVYPDYIQVTGKVGERQVPITREVNTMLCQLAPSGLLFRGPRKPLTRRTLYTIINRICRRAGLDGAKLGPHILRHSASVQHIMAGGDILSLQEELGHTKPTQTAEYAKLAHSQVSEIHQRLNVLGKLTQHRTLERAICRVCSKELIIDPETAKITRCPKCKQVGLWYLPDYHPEWEHGEEIIPSEEREKVEQEHKLPTM